MRSEGIHVTTIAVGDDADTRIMADMAQRGGGQFFRVTDPNVLPRVFIKAIRVVRSPLIRESPFTPEILPTGSPLVEGLSNPPPLRGLVLTQARPEPTITYAMVHPAGEPVLAHWNAGLGRVAAFTSDASTWARAWLDWPGYRQLWTSIARTIARPKSDRTQELTTEIVGDELRIRLDAASEDGKPLDLLTVGGSLYRPDGERAAITLSQTGPGVYEGSAPAPASGNYVVTLLPRMGSRTLSPVVGGVSRAAGVEYRRLKSNIGLLEEISRRTGGRVLDISAADDADLFDRSGVTPSEARLPLWRHLLVLSLVALLLDVGTRRIAWDRLFSREFGATLRREAAAGMRDRTADSIRTLESLRGRGARGIPGAIGPMAGARASVAPPLRSGYSVAPGGAAEPDQTGAEESILDAAPVAPAPLSIEDARQIVRENTERRRAAADTRGKADSSPGARSGADAELADGKTDAPTTGLFAAKERARRRLQGETPDGGD
jgi:hypothetical protein